MRIGMHVILLAMTTVEPHRGHRSSPDGRQVVAVADETSLQQMALLLRYDWQRRWAMRNFLATVLSVIAAACC
jgi:hypothetical protein